MLKKTMEKISRMNFSLKQAGYREIPYNIPKSTGLRGCSGEVQKDCKLWAKKHTYICSLDKGHEEDHSSSIDCRCRR